MSQLLILGGGFAGMMAALNAADENDKAGGDIEITVVSPSDQIVMRPRLYEPHPETLRAPLLPTFEPAGVKFVEGTAIGIDTADRTATVRTPVGEKTLPYDRLILATGSVLRDLPVPGATEHGFNIDSFEEAVRFDAHLKALYAAPVSESRDTFVVIGAGMTGIEIALEMRSRIEIHAGADAAQAARIVLVEQAEVVGPELGDGPRPHISDALEAAGVERRLGASLTSLSADAATLSDGETLPTRSCLITVGMRAHPLTEALAAPRDAAGRLKVDDWQRVEGLPHVYASGDVAEARADEDGHMALMSCQHSRTMGKYAGYNAARDLLGLEPRIYRQPNYTTCLDLGASGAVFSTGWDREVQKTGEEAKARKRWINGELIYPPTGTREEIFEGARIDENGR